VLASAGATSSAGQRLTTVGDSDSEEDEPVGESTFSDRDMDQDGAPSSRVHNIPKSAAGQNKSKRGRREFIMPPEEARAHLRKLYENEPIACALLFGRHGPFAPVTADGFSWASADIFFLEVLPLVPTRFRPASKMGESTFEHPQNELLAKVLNTCVRLRDQNKTIAAATAKDSEVIQTELTALQETMYNTLITLQHDVNSFIDSKHNPTRMPQGKLPPQGVKQLLEKKEGLFRKHMMVRIPVMRVMSFSKRTGRGNE
jgi:DNA-directed RNA polymerase beta' subunit